VTSTQAITGCQMGDIAEHVFLSGDPARIDAITAGWTGCQEVCRVREFRIVSGQLEGLPVTAASTGIGAPSTAILVEELANLGARTLIRVGNSGGLDPSLEIGDLVITTAAIRDDGTSKSYVLPEFPAASHFEVTGALARAAQDSDRPCRLGVTWSFDAFYARNAVLGSDGTLQPMSFGAYPPPDFEARIHAIRATGALNCEMESGVLLTLATLYGLRAGCICVVSDRTPWPGPAAIDLGRNMDDCIAIATKAMLDLARS